MKIFLDANILFSACIEGSRIAILLERVAPHAELISNIHAIREVERNLDSKMPQSSTALNPTFTIRGVSNFFSTHFFRFQPV